MSRPRVTLRRNGTTSLGPSGPPNDSTSTASYGCVTAAGSDAGRIWRVGGLGRRVAVAIAHDVPARAVDALVREPAGWPRSVTITAEQRDHPVLHDLSAAGRAHRGGAGLCLGVSG